MALDKPYKDIPGTTIFDAEQSRLGYHLNQFCMSLMRPRTAPASRPTSAPTSTNGR
jgi:protocatechuate 4,5-dioxygenase alpha subunit